MKRNSVLVRVLAILALVAFVCVSVLTVLPTNVGAQSAQSKIKASQDKQKELKDKINEANTKISANSQEKKKLDDAIGQVQKRIDELNSKISASNAKISAKEAELAEAEKNSREQYDGYLGRAKMMVERGSITYLEVLLNSKSFSDLLQRYAVVKQIVRYDSNRLDELKAIEAQIAAIKQELENEKAGLVTLRADESAEKNTLEQKRAQSQAIIDSLQTDKSAYEKALEEQEAAEAAARAEIKRITEQQSKQPTSAKVPTQYSGSMIRPTSGPVTSPYYMRVHPVTGKLRQHTGMDYGSPYGADIYAASAGTVIVAGYNSGGYGNYVVINHGGGISTLYAHASSLCVSTGQSVSQGQLIAKIGSTGMSTGPHLHFEVLVNGAHTNPANYVGSN